MPTPVSNSSRQPLATSPPFHLDDIVRGLAGRAMRLGRLSVDLLHSQGDIDCQNLISRGRIQIFGRIMDRASNTGSFFVKAMAGLGTPVGGSIPTPNPNFLWQGASSVVVTNASAQAAITFPSAFPSGVVSVVATAGDNNPNLTSAQIINSSLSKTGFTFVAWNNAGSGIANGTVRVNWIALGW